MAIYNRFRIYLGFTINLKEINVLLIYKKIFLIQDKTSKPIIKNKLKPLNSLIHQK